MKIAVVGQVDGYLSKLNDIEADLILSTGSMGIWPDPFYMDRPSRDYASKEFSRMYNNQESLKTPTIFVRGAHEDHLWLRRRREMGRPELLPNLVWLADGYQTVAQNGLRITGLGGVYSEKYYDSSVGWKTRLRAYRRRDVERACSSGPTDLLLIYTEPESKGIQEIIYATRPKLVLHRAIEQSLTAPPYLGAGDSTIFLEWDGNIFKIIS